MKKSVKRIKIPSEKNKQSKEKKKISDIKDSNKFRQFLKRFWFVVWKDDSFRGWILSLIFIFIVIKFIFFPLLNLVTGTSLPLAIVESCSMHHQDNLLSDFDNWWFRHQEKYAEFDITKYTFENSKFKNGFTKGDILFIVGTKPEKLEIGDVIIFNGNERNPIIHRIMSTEQDYITGKYLFSTIGDNNNGQLIIEKNISEDQVVGKAVARIAPYIGWGKLIFYEYKRPITDRGFCEER
jgi:hypothetical protein